MSVVMPCLNEAETLAGCIAQIRKTFATHWVQGEIIVADNDSQDGCDAIAEALGARVVKIARHGYGGALMGGVEAARGEFIVMGDADSSYDFRHIPAFVDKLRAGQTWPWGIGSQAVFKREPCRGCIAILEIPCWLDWAGSSFVAPVATFIAACARFERQHTRD